MGRGPDTSGQLTLGVGENKVTLKQYGYQKPNVVEQRRKAAKQRLETAPPPDPQKVKAWSVTRPVRPDEDEVFLKAMDVVEQGFKGRTMWERADQTGLSVSTLSKHRQLKTKYPRLISVQMQLAALGYTLYIGKTRRN